MADINKLSPFILSFEGNFVNNPNDHGGATKYGVTIKTWKSVGYDKDKDGDIDVADLKLITKEDAVNRILKPHFWDKCKADDIYSQSIANTMVDWYWGSGSISIVKIQKLLGVTADGVVGPNTLRAINSASPETLFKCIYNIRKEFLYRIVKNDPSQKVFIDGWVRRLDAIKFGSLVLNTVPPQVIKFTN